MKAKDKLVVLTSVGSEDMALEIAQELVEGQLAACVNIIPRLRSIYHWKGKICDDRESLMLIKTRDDCFEKVKETITDIIDYECPEIIAFRVASGGKNYLEWVDACVEGREGIDVPDDEKVDDYGDLID